MNALKEGIRVWDRDINRFLTSDYVPLYNPVEEYLYDTCLLYTSWIIHIATFFNATFFANIRNIFEFILKDWSK